MPFQAKRFNGIFTEHCLEHLSLESVDYVLGECFRVLEPGGTIRIVVPDGELYLDGYARITKGEKEMKLPYSERLNYAGIYSPILSVNHIFRSHGHQFIYDFDMIKRLLLKHDFVNIKKESFQSGRDKKMLIDTQSRAVESLYVEASK